MAKNQYKPGTPEWQLWENMESSYAQHRALSADAENLQRRASEAMDRGDAFKAALEKLTR